MHGSRPQNNSIYRKHWHISNGNIKNTKRLLFTCVEKYNDESCEFASEKHVLVSFLSQALTRTQQRASNWVGRRWMCMTNYKSNCISGWQSFITGQQVFDKHKNIHTNWKTHTSVSHMHYCLDKHIHTGVKVKWTKRFELTGQESTCLKYLHFRHVADVLI